jgi:rhodanese-related sulfurtransferase
MKKKLLLGCVVMFLGMGMFVSQLLSADAPRMTKDELKALFGNPDLILLDVRSGSDWKDSDLKIQGAIREEPKKIKSWAEKYSKEKIIILYCAWPNEGTSARVAQQLIKMGYSKVYALKGGWVEWSKNNYPVEKK